MAVVGTNGRKRLQVRRAAKVTGKSLKELRWQPDPPKQKDQPSTST